MADTRVPPTYHMRLEYTTYRMPAELLARLCIDDPRCCGIAVGSGGVALPPGGPPPTPPPSPPGGGGGTIYPTPCECPPGYQLAVVFTYPGGVETFAGYQCQAANDPTNTADCVDDPGGGGGGGGGGSGGDDTGAVPHLTVELTKFRVPASVRVLSTRCVDTPLCVACP